MSILADSLGPVLVAALALHAMSTFEKATWLPRIVDSLLAAVSVIGGITMLDRIDDDLPFRLFDSKMMSSAVVFCSSPTPPSPRAFLACTSAGFVAGVAMHFAGTFGLSPDAVAVGIYVCFSKLSGNSFSAAVGVSSWVGKTPWQGSWSVPLGYLLATWLLGHALLYAFAHAIAVPRRAARLYLTRRAWTTRMSSAVEGDAATDQRLRQLFDKYDSSNDGRIDALEFRVALRAYIGVDVPSDDCEATIRAFDQDGNGTIDFTEFCDAIRGTPVGGKHKRA